MEFIFDISDRPRESMVLAYKILIGLSILMVTLVYSIYRIFDNSVLSPIRFLKKGKTYQLELHGRGIIIMRTFACSIGFTEKGDAVAQPANR